jgi:hypothetical protein
MVASMQVGLIESTPPPATVPADPLYNDRYWHNGRQTWAAREPVRLEYHVRHLEHPDLGTSYEAVVDRLLELLASLGDEELVLAVDTTSVGRPVADMLRAAELRHCASFLLPRTSYLYNSRELQGYAAAFVLVSFC